MKHLTIAATCIAVVPLLIAIFVMKDFRLSDRQNEFDHSGLSGAPARDSDSVHTSSNDHSIEEDDKKGAPVSAL